MEIEELKLSGVLLIKPRVFSDDRGFFKETFQAKRYKDGGTADSFVQDNISRSQQGALRGLHFQRQRPQAKLIQVNQGRIWDVVVDLRRGSQTFGQWTAVELTSDNHLQLFVPTGFAHGFLVLSETADVFYKCSDYYFPDDEQVLRWDDPQVKIDWPDAGKSLILSPKDQAGKLLQNLDAFA